MKPLRGQLRREAFGQDAPPAQTRSSARGVAIEAVIGAERGERANAVLARLLASTHLDERDRALATELAYGTIRMGRACDWLVQRFARRELEAEVRAAARVGAYQLVFMRVPAYAAVSATVAEAPARARPLLNAVLRRVAELVERGPVPWPDLPTRLSYPDWVLERLARDLGSKRALAALEQMNQAAPTTLRSDGYAQGLSSQAVAQKMAELLGLGGDGEHGGTLAGPILDACAAPGGKATLLARHVPLVAAAEIVPDRARLTAAHVARLGLANVSVLLADSGRPPFREGVFAGVLVDAPCSGLGVLHRRPDARWRVQPGDIDRLATLQRTLISAAAPLVRPGGVLVYSVCTLTSAETAGVDAWLASQWHERAGWQACEPPGPPWEPLGRGGLLQPQSDGADGMFMLALRREGP